MLCAACSREWSGEFYDEAKGLLLLKEPGSSIVLSWGEKKLKQWPN